MDRMTRATLWIAFLVLAAYFARTFLDCAMDDTCRLRCASTGGVDMAYRGSGHCVYQRTAPKAIHVDGPTRDHQD
jgi:hypothetical protein